MTASMECLRISCSTSVRSPISPRTKMCRGSCSRSASVSRFPAYVSLSRFTTVQSGRVRRRYLTKLDPMNPHPPVTNTLMCADLDRGGRSLIPFGAVQWQATHPLGKEALTHLDGYLCP